MPTSIIMHTRNYVRELLSEKLPAGMHFHNLKHTEEVVMAAYEIGSQCGLTTEEQNVVTVAAWLHDTGYCFQYKGHEEVSMAIAGTFLRQYNCDDAFIELVLNCIAATCMPQQPKTLKEQVLCDADMFHLASPDYLKYAERLREEWAVIYRQQIDNHEWYNGNLKILTQAPFFTDYGRSVLQATRDKNAKAIKSYLML